MSASSTMIYVRYTSADTRILLSGTGKAPSRPLEQRSKLFRLSRSRPKIQHPLFRRDILQSDTATGRDNLIDHGVVD
jgi:hypothetical protein